MTYMDDVHTDAEHAGKVAARHLQLWFLTIAPISIEIYAPIVNNLNLVAKEMGWPTVHDEMLGSDIIE